MTAPALLFSFLVASVAATLYHVLFGRSLRQLAALWLASIVGFAIGQVLANVLSLNAPQVGPIHLVEALVSSALFMTVVRAIRL
ncbi:MAG: hypothetical protein ACUVWR_00190 [Anaerolineae bacterium]